MKKRGIGSGGGPHWDRFLELERGREAYKSLPQEFYREEMHRVDMETMWRRSWLLAGLSCQIREPHDWMTYTVGDSSVVVTRGADGEARAFHNVCRHRGSRLCREERGHGAALVCPYHQWTYDGTTGALRHARDMGEGFERGGYGLRRAHCRELHGFVWVSMPGEGEEPHFSFEEAAGTLGPQVGPQGVARGRVAYEASYRVRANWKLVYENNRECYHCNKGHPEYIRANYDTAFSYARGPGGEAVRVPEEGAARGEEALQQIAAMDEKWRRQLGVGCTADSAFPGAGWYRATRSPMRRGWQVESMDGRPVCRRLMGGFEDADMGSMRMHTFPNHWTHASSDHAVVTRLTPLAWDLTEATVWWVVDRDAVPGADYSEEAMTPFWKRTSEQDWVLAEDNHRGVMSPHYAPGPLSRLKEEGLEKFIRWYLGTVKSMILMQRSKGQTQI